jgi:hypothetical protein
MRDYMSMTFKLEIPQEVRDQLMEMLIEKKVKNKNFAAQFKAPNELFKSLQSRYV